MSRSKDRKITRLQSRAVWPHVVLTVVAAFIFLMVNIVVISVMTNSTVFNKISSGVGYAQKQAEVILKEKVGSQRELDRVIGNADWQYGGYADKALGAVVTDKDNKILALRGNTVPDFDKVVTLLLGTKKYVLAEDTSFSIVHFEEGDLRIDLAELIRARTRDADKDVQVFNPEWGNSEFIRISIWYCFRDNPNINVYLRLPISISYYEVAAFVIPVGVTTILGMILIIYQIISIVSVVTERRRLLKLLCTDFATGGNNWTYMTRILKKRRFYNKKRGYVMVSFCMEKYDTFCLLNSEKAGEELLEGVYRVLEDNIRKTEFLCRREGADFVLLLVKEDPMVLDGRICSFISEIGRKFPDIKNRMIAGIVNVGENRDVEPGELYNSAVIARKASADKASFLVSWFDTKMKEKMIWEQTVENEMEKALIERQFIMYLQPKFSTVTERLGGAEALVRWKRPETGLVPPGMFIPIFENNGFIMKLDDFMIGEVASVQAKWLSEGKRMFPISVNVSRAHFALGNLAEHICDIVDQYGVPHKYIELELTESAFFDDKEVLLDTLMKLKDEGFPLSMDDFGAGYSSLNTLKELPLDVVKLDAEFFRGNDNFDRAHVIVSETISLAKRLRMHIVAEGIETRDQVDYLASENCDLIQGFYFAKPMPVEEFEELME